MTSSIARRRPIPALLILAITAWPATAQVRECARSDGTTVFTDRRCEDVGGTQRHREEPALSNDDRFHHGTCANDVQDLLYEMTSAIDSHDPNRLASVYHWPGMSGGSGYEVMTRLDELVQRPLVDIVPVMRAAPDGMDGSYYPQTSVRRSPVRVRVEQTLADGITPSRTEFGLQRHLGCWWIRG